MALKKEKTINDMDIMALAATVKPGGEVDEEKLAREKSFTIILKGKRTFDIQAENEDEALTLFKEDDVFGHEKVIDIIETESMKNDSMVTQGYNEIVERSHVKKTVKENNPAQMAKENAKKDRIIMVMNPDGTSSEVKETVAPKKKRATKKK